MSDFESSFAPQTSQAPVSAFGEPIGTVENLAGKVTIIHVDGSTTQASKGTAVYQGDHVETGEIAHIGITFVDDSTFALGSNGEMTLDEMVYDPGSQTGNMGIHVVEGVFSFVSGQIAKTSSDAMTISTPVSTIGVRGSKADGVHRETTTVTLGRDPDGSIGEVNVNGQTLSRYNETTQASNKYLPAKDPIILPDNVVSRFYGETRDISTRQASERQTQRSTEKDQTQGGGSAARGGQGDEAGVPGDIPTGAVFGPEGPVPQKAEQTAEIGMSVGEAAFQKALLQGADLGTAFNAALEAGGTVVSMADAGLIAGLGSIGLEGTGGISQTELAALMDAVATGIVDQMLSASGDPGTNLFGPGPDFSQFLPPGMESFSIPGQPIGVEQGGELFEDFGPALDPFPETVEDPFVDLFLFGGTDPLFGDGYGFLGPFGDTFDPFPGPPTEGPGNENDTPGVDLKNQAIFTDVQKGTAGNDELTGGRDSVTGNSLNSNFWFTDDGYGTVMDPTIGAAGVGGTDIVNGNGGINQIAFSSLYDITIKMVNDAGSKNAGHVNIWSTAIASTGEGTLNAPTGVYSTSASSIAYSGVSQFLVGYQAIPASFKSYSAIAEGGATQALFDVLVVPNMSAGWTGYGISGTDTTDDFIINHTSVNSGTSLGMVVYGHGGDDTFDIQTGGHHYLIGHPNTRNIFTYANMDVAKELTADTNSDYGLKATVGLHDIAVVDRYAAKGSEKLVDSLWDIADLTLSSGTDYLYFGGSATGSFRTLSTGDGIDEIVIDSSSTATVLNLDGGAGNDTITMNGGTINATLSGGAGNDTITANGGTIKATPFGKATLSGGTGDDTINISGATIDRVYGDAGDDTITMSGGDVGKIYAGDGNDTIIITGGTITKFYGDAGNDTLVGRSADESLSGGSGTDILTGNGGSDVFRYDKNANDSTVGSMDHITDFAFGASGDKIATTGIIGALALPTTATQSTGDTFANLTLATLNALVGSSSSSPLTTFSGGGNTEALRLATTDSRDILAIDVNGDGSIDASNDTVIDVTGASGTIDASNFA